jgi:hypothetical protein
MKRDHVSPALRRKIKAGLADIRAGRTISLEAYILKWARRRKMGKKKKTV